MADQKETYGYESKFTGGRMEPEKLVIVGVDCPDEQRPELADPDRNRIPIDQEMVKSIALHGVRVPIVIRKFRGDEHVYVVAGRRRVIHAREANKHHAGDAPILVPCVPDDNPDPVVSFTVENEFRVDSTPLAKARHAARLKVRGKSDADICALYGIKKQALVNWWALLESPPAVQTAVEEGRITATVGAEIAKVEPSKQQEALEAAIAAGRGSEAQEAVRLMRRPHKGAAEDEDRGRRFNVKRIKQFAAELSPPKGETCDDHDTLVAIAVLSAVLGEPKPLKQFSSVHKAYKRIAGGAA